MDTEDRLLSEQAAYYRASATDYLEQVLDLPGGGELTEALARFQPKGSVLELACGPSVWTGQLLDYATDVTAVDASAEMLAIAAARVGSERVRFIQADLFTWRPDAATTSFSWGSGFRMSRPDGLSPSGHSWRTALNQEVACSSPTTRTAPRTNSWKARRPRPSAGRALMEPRTGS
jgi:SAM-dependent methyltransferase